jgi:hypothetical protein
MKKALITVIVVATFVAFSPAVFSHGGGRMKGNPATAAADPAAGPGAMHHKGKGKAKGKGMGKGKGKGAGKGGPGHGGKGPKGAEQEQK